ncbi:LPS-assembly protein LptD [Loktanella agnita]|uniref:LPS-assembly protein LptD n=1 Tax=Loktanella agnita TaxID=287097 RepID=UPI003986885C
MRLLLLILMLLPQLGRAQGAATLVADDVILTADEQLIASGNVEVLYDGTTLRAARIIYDSEGDRLTIEGPIVIRAADGTLLTANRAELDPTLENGILLGARLVLDQKLQMAANQIDRREGRYSQLYKTVATSCQICGDSAPLWEIRAERVVHDDVERQLYFENATFHIKGLPLLWLPRMRLPDPQLNRANGLLIPEQRNTSQLGSGLKIPYFITLGDHRDVTLTPYISAETRTLELIYRQAFVNGDLRVEGAVSDDTLLPENRSYLFANGRFALPRAYQLTFDIEAVSDPAYLLDYGYSDKDRLDSAISLLRVTDTTLFETRFTYHQTLRDDESNASLPPIVADVTYETRLRPAFGGTLTLGADFDTAYRYSDTDGDAGRDVSRAGGQARWQDSWLFDGGVVAKFQTALRADYYNVEDDSAYTENDVRVAPAIGAELRWPLGRQMPSGTAHLIEPVMAVSGAETFGSTPPNEDSTRTEFGPANLTALSRFPGEDAVETDSQAALGVTWTRTGAEGLTSLLSFGRVVRGREITEYSRSSGLDGLRSDWLIAGQITTPDGFIIDAQALVDEDRGLNRATGRIAWQNDEVALRADYIWQGKDAAEDRPDTISEWTLESEFTLTDAWSLGLDARYDVAADRPVRGEIGLQWRNECVTVDVSASRRYTSSTTVDPTTTFGLSASLSGFSSNRSGGPAAGCTN